MKRSIIILVSALLGLSTSALHAEKRDKGERGERGYSESAPQPENARRVRAGHDKQKVEREAKPKPKPKPKKESGEKGGTEDINIGIGELEE